MLQNAYFLAKIGADTAENELNLAEIFRVGRPGSPQRVQDPADAEGEGPRGAPRGAPRPHGARAGRLARSF